MKGSWSVTGEVNCILYNIDLPDAFLCSHGRFLVGPLV